MKEAKKPEPVVLKGRVYVHGALEESFPSQRCLANPEIGTLRIHTHLDQAGLARRARGYCSAGYSGVIRASLFDGKVWRKFMLALEMQPEVRCFSQYSQRPEKARIVLRVLGLLKGKTCIYRDGAYAVDDSIAVVVETPAKPQTALASSAPASKAVCARQGTLFGIEDVPVKKAKPRSRPGSKRHVSSRKQEQPLLF